MKVIHVEPFNPQNCTVYYSVEDKPGIYFLIISYNELEGYFDENFRATDLERVALFADTYIMGTVRHHEKYDAIEDVLAAEPHLLTKFQPYL